MKHYIRIDKDKNIIHAFSEAFEQPEPKDICVNQNGGRHFNLDMFDMDGKYNYKYENKKIVKRTEEEKIPTNELIEEKIKQVKQHAEELLSKTDWKIIRAIENGETETDDFKKLKKERKAIRDWSNKREEEINALTTREDIANAKTTKDD